MANNKDTLEEFAEENPVLNASSREVLDFQQGTTSYKLVALPSSLLFGYIVMAQSKVQEVRLINEGFLPLTIQGFASDNLSFEIIQSKANTLYPGQTSVITVAFKADNWGANLGTLSVQTKEAGTFQFQMKASAVWNHPNPEWDNFPEFLAQMNIIDLAMNHLWPAE